MAKILITGSLGLIGSHLVDYLHSIGHTVYGVDNLSTGFRTNQNDDICTTIFDLVKNPEQINDLIEYVRPDVIYACAAWAHEGLSSFCPIRISENNFNATMNTLIPSIKYGVKRFVFFSSMSVYGNQEAPFNEDMERKPEDVYAVSKTACERNIELLSSVHEFEYTILRPHNVIGERQSLSDPYRNVAGIFMRRALQGKNLIIYGDGTQKRSFSYIGDAIPCIARAGFERKAINQIINIGPTEEFTINELAQEVIKLQGGTISLEYQPPRPLEVKNAWCTNTKAKEILGFETKTSFKEGLEKMWEWAKELYETTGIAEPRYLDELEIVSESTPSVWLNKTI